jgi:hypothetical protein
VKDVVSVHEPDSRFAASHRRGSVGDRRAYFVSLSEIRFSNRPAQTR